MKVCINEATTMLSDFETDMRAYSRAGFTAVELWLDTVQEFVGERGVGAAARLLTSLGLEAVCGSAHGGVMLAEGDDRRRALDEFCAKLDLCEALGAPKMVVFAGRRCQATAEVYDRMVTNIREAADLAADRGVTLALEFIKAHPVLGSLATACELTRRVDRANVGVLLDFFHFMCGVSKMSDLDSLTSESLAFVHVNDALALPRELLTDADRVWLGQGCFPLSAFRDCLDRLAYADCVSLELFNRSLWERDPFEVAELVYRNVSSFIAGDL